MEEKEEFSLIKDVCHELGLDAVQEFERLKDSVFSEFIKGNDPQTALIDTDVIRMWLASMISRDQVKPKMRTTFDQIRQLGTYELREAWEISEVPKEKFQEMILYGKTNAKTDLGRRILH